jgi:DUF971 family protein
MSIGTIEELKAKKCQPCEGGVPPVAREEAQRLLKDLPGWRLTEDGQRIRREFRKLREACPCATCREKRTSEQQSATLLPVLSAAEAEPRRIAGMKPVGSYAYTIAFSDGHDTGIFSFNLLLTLGESVT